LAKFDDYLREERIKKAISNFDDGLKVLDIGCHNRLLFIRKKVSADSVGIDELEQPAAENYDFTDYTVFHKLHIENDIPIIDTFDVITMLAMFEHLQNREAVVKECFRLLKAGGLVVMTVPSAKADILLSFFVKIKVITEKDFWQQHKNVPDKQAICNMFETNGFRLLKYESFELGLNNLYVFIKISKEG